LPGGVLRTNRGHCCSFYANTDLGVINSYLTRQNRVLGIVELFGEVGQNGVGGGVVLCEQGYRGKALAWPRS